MPGLTVTEYGAVPLGRADGSYCQVRFTQTASRHG